MFKKRLKPLPQSVAMGSDPSPATPDSATARTAEGHSPGSTFQRQRPVHRENVEKLLPKNVLQLGLQKTTFSLLAKTQANNNGRHSFLQNQPVAARGINNKNFHYWQ